jgi:hypothetical protein
MINYQKNNGVWSKLPNELYIIGDIHGDFFTLKHSLELTECVYFDEYLEELQYHKDTNTYNLDDGCKYYSFEKNNIHWNPNKTNCFIVFTGDIIDRCRPIMKDGTCSNVVNDENCDYLLLLLLINLDKEARKYNSRVIIILGNHELLHISEDYRYVSNKNKNDERIDNINKLLIENINNLYGLIRINCYIIVHGGINDIFFSKVNKVLRNTNNNHLESTDIYNNYIRDYILHKLPKTYKSMHNNQISSFWNRTLGGTNNTHINQSELDSNLEISPFWDRTLGGTKSLNEGQCENIFINNILHVKDSSINNLKIVVAHCPQFMIAQPINVVNCQDYENKIYRIDVGMSRAFDMYIEGDQLIILLNKLLNNINNLEIIDIKIFFNDYNRDNRKVSILKITETEKTVHIGELTLDYFYRTSLNKNIKHKYLFLLSDLKRVNSNKTEIINLTNQIINLLKQ